VPWDVPSGTLDPFADLVGCCGRPRSAWLGRRGQSSHHPRNKSVPPSFAHALGRTGQDLGNICRGPNNEWTSLPEDLRHHARKIVVDPNKSKASQQHVSDACCQNIGVRLFKCGERHRKAREQQMLHAAKMKLAHEMEECTFFPQTNCACRLVPSKNDESSLSLYERGVRQQLRRQRSEEEGRELKALKELQGCTFHPAINRVPAPSSHALVPWTSFEKSSTERMLGDSCNCELATAEDVASSVLTMLRGWKGQRLHETTIPQATTIQPCSVPCQMLQQHVSPPFFFGAHSLHSLCTYFDGPSSGTCNKIVHRESLQPSISSVGRGANQVDDVFPAVATRHSQDSPFLTQQPCVHSSGVRQTAALQDEAAFVQNRSSGRIEAQAGDAQMVICMLEEWKAGRHAGGQA